MTVYVTAQLTIRDRTAYAAYEAGFMDVFRKFGGAMLAVDEKPTLLEGAWTGTRCVLISFPDEAACRAWWDSPEYQDLARHRRAGSDALILIMHGLR